MGERVSERVSEWVREWENEVRYAVKAVCSIGGLPCLAKTDSGDREVRERAQSDYLSIT